ncbi:MAG: ECF transporter S component [Bifidobacteriaceae bacterium]|jgi:energy-coupling factor transport system substrate-specific component|nr:ECF transporter S component [Bifidobacteriaceae bacterium]
MKSKIATATRPIPLNWRTTAILMLASAVALLLLAWPLLVPTTGGQDVVPAAFALAGLLPVVVLTVLAAMAESGMDAKSLAMLGVLAATVAALRPLGSGLGGVEPMLFVLVLAGRVFGPGFGFALGALSLLASAVLTGGIGPWLPAQMVVSAWVGLGAGCLPKTAGRRSEMLWLCGYAVVAAYLFGLLMNLWFWPSLAGGQGDTALAYQPGGSLVTNLAAFIRFSLVTSTASWDTVRAVTAVVLMLVVGPSALTLLRRCARRANFRP